MVKDVDGNSLPQCPTKKDFVVDSIPYYWGNCGTNCLGSPERIIRGTGKRTFKNTETRYFRYFNI